MPVRLAKVFQAIYFIYKAVILPHHEPPVLLSFRFLSVLGNCSDFPGSPGVSSSKAILPGGSPGNLQGSRFPSPFVMTRWSVPVYISVDCFPPTTCFESVFAHFDLSSFPLRTVRTLLACGRRPHPGERLSCFPLPTVTGVHRHEIHHYYGFVCHPLASFGLTFPLEPPLPAPSRRTWRVSPGKFACLSTSASVITHQVIQLLGVPISRRVTHLASQHRFTCARSRTPPSASFRPRRYRRRPCLWVVFPLVG